MKTLKQIISEANAINHTPHDVILKSTGKLHPYHLSTEHRKLIHSVFPNSNAMRKLHPKSKKPDGGPWHYDREAHASHGKTVYVFKHDHGKLIAHALHHESADDVHNPKKSYTHVTSHEIKSRAQLEKLKKDLE